MNLGNIVIVECVSSGKNFVQDCINRNYSPIALQSKVGDSKEEEGYRKSMDDALSYISADCEVITQKDTYEENLEMVREYNPVLVVPGSERGVVLATKLANDLNLLCNPIENLDAITLKDKMHEKLAENGLRHIRGRRVSSVQEAIDFYDEENLTEVVTKPVYGSGSVAVKVCLNRQEMIDSLEQQFNDINRFGDDIKEIVVQERIKGDEYIVNTVSHDGVPRVTTIWKYSKVKTQNKDNIYDYMETVNEFDFGEVEIVEYAFKVCDALGIKYGPVHGEFMVDEKGPVLIEVNCRPMGGTMDPDYLDTISGQHETDSIFDSYLNPDKFYYQLRKGYELYEYGAVKWFIVPKNILAKSNPIGVLSKYLKSHFRTVLDPLDSPVKFVKTKDFETTGGAIFLVHPDPHVLENDIEMLRNIERFAFDFILNEEVYEPMFIDENKVRENIELLLDEIPKYGTAVFITDEVYDNVTMLQALVDEMDNVEGEFDCVVVNLNKTLMEIEDYNKAVLLLKCFDFVKKGGVIIVPPTTYNIVPHGKIGVEALLEIKDFKLKMPVYSLDGFVFASKR